jgi:TetR/AcrR family transcriptional repressor of nem operon
MYRKNDIIEQGVELFRKQGYNETGISDILKACDIPKGSFYNYFNSKEDYCIKALDHYGDAQLEFMKGILMDSSTSPAERLKAFYRILIELNSEEEVKSGCLVNNISNEMGGLNDRLAEAANRNFNKWINIIARVVAKGQAVNDIRNDMGALELAEYLHGTFYGMLSRMKATRETDALNDWYKMTFKFIVTQGNNLNQN